MKQFFFSCFPIFSLTFSPNIRKKLIQLSEEKNLFISTLQTEGSFPTVSLETSMNSEIGSRWSIFIHNQNPRLWECVGAVEKLRKENEGKFVREATTKGRKKFSMKMRNNPGLGGGFCCADNDLIHYDFVELFFSRHSSRRLRSPREPVE
jgi:hypothetical protein